MPVRQNCVAALSRRGALAATLVLLLAACGGSPASSGSTFSPIPPGDGSGIPPTATAPSPSASPAAAGLLLEVTTEGGFINPSATIGALPLVVVDTDGRIFTPAAVPGTSTLVPAVDVRDTGAAGAAAIREAMRAAGLDVEGAGGGSGGIVADAGTIVFTAVIDGVEVVNRVSGGGPGPIGGVGGPGRPGASGDGNTASGSPGPAAVALLGRLRDSSQAWGAATAPTSTRLVPVAYRTWIAPLPGGTAGAASVAWPLTGDPSEFGTPAAADLGIAGLRTGIVAGADVAALDRALATAAPGTVLTAGDTVWQVWIRPLLPDEGGG